MDNWLYTYTTTEYDYGDGNDWTYSQVRNGRTASVTGFEVSLQSKLQFLPGFLSNLTYYGNYTFTDSKTDGVDGREDIPLVGAVKNMFNSSLAYETKKMFVRASLNYSGEALDEVGGAEWEDRYYDQQLFVDVNASYAISDSIRLFAELKNLTNQPLRYYQGIAERTMQMEYYNYSWNAGVKIDF
jgi:TonB-dependent receptor